MDSVNQPLLKIYKSVFIAKIDLNIFNRKNVRCKNNAQEKGGHFLELFTCIPACVVEGRALLYVKIDASNAMS